MASRKLNWRTPQERLTGETSDISIFRFHFWQPIEYYNPIPKQSHDVWTPGRFLGIAWESGDPMTYYIETSNQRGRPTVLVRSTMRALNVLPNLPIGPSGERRIEEELDRRNLITDDQATAEDNQLLANSEGPNGNPNGHTDNEANQNTLDVDMG